MSTAIRKIEFDKDLLKTINKLAKNENTTETQLIMDMIKKEVKNRTKNKIPDYLIANKDTYNPDPERFLGNAGFIKNVKPFDAVKLIREAREGR